MAPEAGVQTRVGLVSTASVTVGANETTAPAAEVASTPRISAWVTVGAVVSITSTVVVQVWLLPAPSVAVTVTVWTPTPTSAPAAGLWLSTIAPDGVTLSVRGLRRAGRALVPDQ